MNSLEEEINQLKNQIEELEKDYIEVIKKHVATIIELESQNSELRTELESAIIQIISLKGS